MRHTIAILWVFSLALAAGAAWRWPFGSDETAKPRMSELMEPASLLMDEASDLASDGKVAEAVEKYRLAYAELERIEIENPDRAESSEFSTVRNKKAYIDSAIDSLLLDQAKKNTKAVVNTDTTELEKRYAEKKAAEKPPEEKPGRPAGTLTARESQGAGMSRLLGAHKAKMQAAADALKAGEYDEARRRVQDILALRPNDPAALNLRAAVEAASGDLETAERTLVQLTQSNPGTYYGFYNLAKLTLQMRGDAGKEPARRYYEHGRENCGGPIDDELEAKLK